MKVLIDGRYAYETDLEDVRVGDEMVLPGSSFSEPWSGIVTELEPKRAGRCVKMIGLSRRKAQVESEREALAKVEIQGWVVGNEIRRVCSDCGAERLFAVQRVNRNGRPTSINVTACGCGAPAQGIGLGSASAFRYFMIEPDGIGI